MKKMVRCKACGYILAESDLSDKCPACGASSKVFEPYTDPVGEKRRKLLRLDLHPIAVHFPTAFSVAVFVFALGYLILPAAIRGMLAAAIQVLALFLPLVVLLSMLVGLLDGKIRFHNIGKSQILRTKIGVASVYLVLAVGLALAAWLDIAKGAIFTWGTLALSAGCIACSVVLSLLGTSILNAAFPGE